MSSISGTSGKPPAASKALRRMNIAWSPVAMPVRRERQFIIAPTTRSIGRGLAMCTSKRPQTAPPSRAWRSSASACDFWILRPQKNCNSAQALSREMPIK